MNKNLFFILFFILFYLIQSSVFANSITDHNWMKKLEIEKLSSKDQAYCYTDENGNVEGQNVDLKVRLASVTKLITSLWSIEKLGVNYTFNTRIYISGNNLHIQGSYDPFFGSEKLFYLISELNKLGYENFDTITFDKNLMLFPDVAYEADQYPDMSPANLEKIILYYFNTSKWSKNEINEYAGFKTIAPEGTFLPKVNFSVKNVIFSETNSMLKNSDLRTLNLNSPPLFKYLKEMNVKSNNYVAETLFRLNGDVKIFEQYQLLKFNFNSEALHLFTGNGLPFYDEQGTRFDNYSTCANVLKIIAALKNEVEKQHMKIEDIVAVPGSDKGTFRNRIFSSELKNSFVAKTGTLVNTSTLAGLMSSQMGISFYGIYNQSPDISASKRVQNEMISSIMTELGGPKVFEYKVLPFFSYSTNEFKMFSSETFSTIANSLY